MLAKDIISDVVPSIKTSDSGVKALHWMDIFRISQIPIVNNQDFLGLISDSDIYDLNKADEPVGNHNLSLMKPYVYEDQHIYEVIGIVSEHQLSVIPVLNHDQHYLGLIVLTDLLQYFAGLAALNHPGAIIVLELNERDYSLSEISQIVESNDAKILSLYISSPDDSIQVEVTLKINKTDLSSILQTFERYNYKIKASYLKEEVLDELFENRYESFIRYLNT